MNECENNSFFEVNGWKVYYEKFGSGPNPILLIPGPIGTGRTDFEDLLDGEDELDFDKFTVIAVEAPGWGRSRPPLRKYGNNVYNNDCECFIALMNHLGYDKFSIIGWSEGSKVALLMSIKYRESVDSLVLNAISTYTSNKSLNFLQSTKSIENWNNNKVKEYLKSYKTKDEIQKLWTRYLSFIEHFNQYFPEDIFKNKYHLVRCPVLIVHGDQDQIIEKEQPLNIFQQLSNSKIHRFPKGEHDCHKKYSAQFVKLVQDHLLNKNVIYSKEEDVEIIRDRFQEQVMSNNILA